MEQFNSENFEKVYRLIQAAPDRRCKMAHFGQHLFDEDLDYFNNMSEFEGQLHNCGTAMCIAGWCAALAIEEGQVFDHDDGGYYSFTEGIMEAAGTYLGLTDEEADALFVPLESGRYGVGVNSAGKPEMLKMMQTLYNEKTGRNLDGTV